MRFTVLGKRWDVVWVGKTAVIPGDFSFADGMCEAPGTKGKRIFIREGQGLRETVEAVLHELLHAADWSKDEEWVHDTAHDATREVLKVLRHIGAL